jgi:hypothetical protein
MPIFLGGVMVKYRYILLLVQVMSLVCLADSDVEQKLQKVIERHNTAEFGLVYDFTVPGKTTRIKFTTVVPSTLPDRQKITVQYRPRPSKVFDKNGNRYAEFVFVKPESQFRVEINLKAEMYRYDLSTAQRREKKRLSKGPAFVDFLKEEKYVEKNNPRIQQIAEDITGENESEVVEKIYNYVIDNMEYGGYKSEPAGASQALAQCEGDCTEYTHLFVAICRAKNIPAKVISGYITKFDVTPRHNWAEVYLKEYGWVPFDPTLGDDENPSVRMRAFRTLEPIYISRTHFINDEALNGQLYYWFEYVGDKVEVQSSIEFKKSSIRGHVSF